MLNNIVSEQTLSQSKLSMEILPRKKKNMASGTNWVKNKTVHSLPNIRAKSTGLVNYSPFSVKFSALGKNEPFPTRLTWKFLCLSPKPTHLLEFLIIYWDWELSDILSSTESYEFELP